MKSEEDEMDTIKKQINFEIKQLGEEKERVLRFVGSDENPDRDSDIIEVAGWKTDEYMKNPVFLWAHNGHMTPPIGKAVNVTKDLIAKKLIFDIKFPTIEELSSDIENPAEHAKFTDMIYNMYKNGYMNATSVGFKGLKIKTRDDASVIDKPEWQRGKRYIEQNLLELSAVPIPANANALIDASSKGLIDENTIKSFFIPKNEETEVGKVENEIIEEKTEQEIEEKAGARLSKETSTLLKACADSIEKAIGEHKASHKEQTKKYNKCMEQLKSLMGECEPEEPEGDDPPEEDIEPKNLKDEIKKAFNELKDEGFFVEQKGINEAEIDLDNIEFENAEKKAAHDELGITPEEIKKMFEEVVSQKLNAALGKID
jgi:uncharacterized protein